MGVLLNLPYKSQSDPDAGMARNDCGPACLAMLLNALGIPATTDAVFHRTGGAPDNYISAAQIIRVGESYGVPLDFRTGWTLGQLQGALIQARPVIALVHYGAFSELQPGISTQSSFKGPHFVLVVGFDEQHVIVHDPLWRDDRRREGAFKAWPLKVWMDAWGRCHEDCDPATGRCNPDFTVMASVRAVSNQQVLAVPADLVRRIRAKVAFDGQIQPQLTQPAVVHSYELALGTWGRRIKAHRVQPTDTLWRLAKAYYGQGEKMDVIRHFNGLAETDVIYNGQTLLIPEPTLSGAIPPERRPIGGTILKPPR